MEDVYFSHTLRELLIDKLHRLNSRKYVIELTMEEITLFRGAFMDRQTEVGFDENYELTTEGRILDDLIDDFFLPIIKNDEIR